MFAQRSHCRTGLPVTIVALAAEVAREKERTLAKVKAIAQVEQ